MTCGYKDQADLIKLKHPIFVDDEPLVIEMMMNLLNDLLGSKIDYTVYSDPDEVADLIEEQKITGDHLIIIDRFLFQRDTLDMQLPQLYRHLGFQGQLLIFSYIPVEAKEFGYDGYIRKDLNSVEAFVEWIKD